MNHAFIEPLETRIAPATLSIASPAGIREGDSGASDLTFIVTLTSDATSAVTVNFSTADGTATTADNDFTPTAGTLTFALGETSKEIKVPIVGDTNVEAHETFTVTLDTPTGDATLAAATATGTILNDESKISIADQRFTEGDSGTRTAAFTVTLSQPNAETVTVDFATADGTAASVGAPPDFQALTGTVTFAPDEVTKTISVVLYSDTIQESDEGFAVNLSNPVHGQLDKAQGLGTILNDDPKIAISNGQVVEGDSGTSNIVFTVSLSSLNSEIVTVDYASADGTATASDYAAVAGTLSFAPGVMTQTIIVQVNGDTNPEAAENFSINLTTPTRAAIASAQGQGTILNDDPKIFIDDPTIVEGDFGTSDLVFNVTLSAASAGSITVNYATADGTAKSGGFFPDYLPASGTLTFAPGETSKTIVVPILGDIFKEANDDRFLVNLSGAVNAFLGDAQGAGTIANGADVVVGIKVSDAATVEGDSSDPRLLKMAIFNVEISDKTAGDVTFSAATRNGTAVKGQDFQEITGPRIIAAGQTTTTLSVPIRGDTAFEATESFFLDVSNFSANVTPVGADASGVLHARGTIYNDDFQSLAGGRTVQWIDVDGDLVTLKISKGSLNALGLVPAGSVGGRQLQTLDLFSQSRGVGQFAGASISIVAEKQPGFPGVSDGRVDVGQIIASVILQNELQFIGVDLGVVTVDGDLGKITVGDVFSTPAIARLDVFSLGARGTATGAPNVQSDVLGPIGTVHVASTLEGYLHVIGQEFGRIGTLRVDGAIKGGAAPNSGSVAVTGRIGTVIVKDILGGDGLASGALLGNSNTGGSIGNVTVTGSIVGGAGPFSGKILGPRIGNVTVAGSVIGGDGGFSGGIGLDSLGTVQNEAGMIIAQVGATASLGAVKIGGSLVGGAGGESGKIGSGGNLPSATVLGSVIGGSGNGAGGIAVGGALGRLDIRGDLQGGDAPTGQTLNLSGFVAAGSIGSAIIGGKLKAGVNNGAGISNSGVIRSGTLGALTVGGDVTGTAANPAIISAIGNIRSVVIKGAVNFAEILAGYNNTTSFTSAAGFRGMAVNADAQIGSVIIEKSVLGLNIVAGAAAGTGGRFGDATDVVSSGTGVVNSPRILSQIASVIFKGALLPNDASFGIVAQSIVSVKVGAAPVPLIRGAGNDPGIEIGGDTNFRAVELHV